MPKDYSTYNDGQLLALLRDDDEAAFTEIYNRYWKLLFAISFKHLNNKQSAEDIVHEVFMSIWSKRHNLQIAFFKAWLGSAAKYMIIAEMNRRLKKELYPSQLPEISQNSTQNTLDFCFLDDYLQREISLLPPQCRLIFSYSRQTEMSNAEIAQKIGISEKAVEKQITIARKRLNIALRNFFFSAL